MQIIQSCWQANSGVPVRSTACPTEAFLGLRLAGAAFCLHAPRCWLTTPQASSWLAAAPKEPGLAGIFPERLRPQMIFPDRRWRGLTTISAGPLLMFTERKQIRYRLEAFSLSPLRLAELPAVARGNRGKVNRQTTNFESWYRGKGFQPSGPKFHLSLNFRDLL